MEATFLAAGVFISLPTEGFLRYWQRQGCCCLILVQHSALGGVFEEIAPLHTDSSVGLHTTVLTDTLASLRRSTTIRTAVAVVAARTEILMLAEPFIFFYFFLAVSDMEKSEKFVSIYRGIGWNEKLPSVVYQ